MKRTRYDPGQLRQFFTHNRSTQVVDECGELSVNTQHIGSLWGTLTPKKAAQLRLADQDVEEILHEIVIRFHDNIEAGDTLALPNRIFEILTVHDPDERQQYLLCKTREVSP